jgi:hypothetical protein
MRTHPTREKLHGQSRIYTHRLLFFNFVSYASLQNKAAAQLFGEVKMLNLLSFHPH